MARGDSRLRVINTLTRSYPEGWTGRRGRIDGTLLVETVFAREKNPRIFVCGPTDFVESISGLLVEVGYDPPTIKTERFGPSGG
jgi:ferredoxin-NADP reductase